LVLAHSNAIPEQWGTAAVLISVACGLLIRQHGWQALFVLASLPAWLVLAAMIRAIYQGAWSVPAVAALWRLGLSSGFNTWASSGVLYVDAADGLIPVTASAARVELEVGLAMGLALMAGRWCSNERRGSSRGVWPSVATFVAVVAAGQVLRLSAFMSWESVLALSPADARVVLAHPAAVGLTWVLAAYLAGAAEDRCSVQSD
jgi:hypothetical protein